MEQHAIDALGQRAIGLAARELRDLAIEPRPAREHGLVVERELAARARSRENRGGTPTSSSASCSLASKQVSAHSAIASSPAPLAPRVARGRSPARGQCAANDIELRRAARATASTASCARRSVRAARSIAAMQLGQAALRARGDRHDLAADELARARAHRVRRRRPRRPSSVRRRNARRARGTAAADRPSARAGSRRGRRRRHRARLAGEPGERVERDLLLGAARVEAVRAGEIVELGGSARQRQRAGAALDRDAGIVRDLRATGR